MTRKIALAVFALPFGLILVGCSSSKVTKSTTGGSQGSSVGSTSLPPLTPGATSGPSKVKVVLDGDSTELRGTGSCQVNHVQDPTVGTFDSLVFNLLPAQPMLQAEIYINRKSDGLGEVGAAKARFNDTERIYFAPGFSPSDPSDAAVAVSDKDYIISGYATVLSMDFKPTTLKQHAPFRIEFSCP